MAAKMKKSQSVPPSADQDGKITKQLVTIVELKEMAMPLFTNASLIAAMKVHLRSNNIKLWLEPYCNARGAAIPITSLAELYSSKLQICKLSDANACLSFLRAQSYNRKIRQLAGLITYGFVLLDYQHADTIGREISQYQFIIIIKFKEPHLRRS